MAGARGGRAQDQGAGVPAPARVLLRRHRRGARTALELRRAADSDFAAIRDVAWRSWEAAYGGFVPEADRAAFFAGFYAEEGHRRAVRSERSLYLVAEDAGSPIAFVLATRDGAVVRLHRLYADPRRWRRGAGQLLWDELVRWSKGRGAERIEFEVASDGGPGPRFYRKQGCRAVEDTVMPVGRTAVRVTRYEKDLVPHGPDAR